MCPKCRCPKGEGDPKSVLSVQLLFTFMVLLVVTYIEIHSQLVQGGKRSGNESTQRQSDSFLVQMRNVY